MYQKQHFRLGIWHLPGSFCFQKAQQPKSAINSDCPTHSLANFSIQDILHIENSLPHWCDLNVECPPKTYVSSLLCYWEVMGTWTIRLNGKLGSMLWKELEPWYLPLGSREMSSSFHLTLLPSCSMHKLLFLYSLGHTPTLPKKNWESSRAALAVRTFYECD